MTIHQWDKTIAPALHRIEDNAFRIETAAGSISAAIDILASRPEWQTKAGAGLDDAANALRRALAKVEHTQKAYRAKPVILEAAE